MNVVIDTKGRCNLVPQTLSPGWRLSIGDYKRPLRKVWYGVMLIPFCSENSQISWLLIGSQELSIKYMSQSRLQ